MRSALTFSDLQQLTGYTRPGDVERCLKDQGIKFYWGKAGPWTTLELLNAPHISRHTAQSHDPIQF